jgi:periplasmic protein TonB
MEPKKNPKYDLHQQRGVLLNVGLVVSLIILITAFRWSTPIVNGPTCRFDNTLQESVLLDDPRTTMFKKVEIPKAKKVRVSVPLTPNFQEVKNIDAEEDKPRPADPDEFDSGIDFGNVEIPIEVIPPDTFRVVEKMPAPIGGWVAFYKTLSKNFKYPRQAERVGAEGKVFVEFTVNDKGELSHFKIIKGIGYGCDEEAKRVIALTKWTAGKQRGRAVNVKMVQPIVFSME